MQSIAQLYAQHHEEAAQLDLLRELLMIAFTAPDPQATLTQAVQQCLQVLQRQEVQA